MLVNIWVYWVFINNVWESIGYIKMIELLGKRKFVFCSGIFVVEFFFMSWGRREKLGK